MQHLDEHTFPNGSRLISVGPPREITSLVGLTFATPHNDQALHSAYLNSVFQKHDDLGLTRETGRNVRQDAGLMQVWHHLGNVAWMARSSQPQSCKQFDWMLSYVEQSICPSSAFEVVKEQTTQDLLSDNHLDTKMDCMRLWSCLEAFQPYLGSPQAWAKHIQELSYEHFVKSMQDLRRRPLTVIACGITDDDREYMQDQLAKLPMPEDIAGTFTSPADANVTRLTSADPVAYHRFEFVMDEPSLSSSVMMEWLRTLVAQKMGKTSAVRTLHSPGCAALSMDATMPITQIPGHMESTWKYLRSLTQTSPEKKRMAFAINNTYVQFAKMFESPSLLARYLVTQNKFHLDKDWMQKLLGSQNLDVAQWMDFVQQLLSFERQQVYEVVPAMYGEGAKKESRFESLTKRLGPLEEVEACGDTFQFPSLMLSHETSKPQKYFQSHVLEGNHTLIFNEDPSQSLAHLALYFEGGRRFEHRKNAGVTQLLMMHVLYGSAEKRKIKKQLQQEGVEIDIENTADFFGLHITMHPSKVEKTIPLLVVLVFNTPIDEKYFHELSLSLLREQNTKEPFFRSVELFYESLFGAHGYGLPRLGFSQSVLELQKEHIQHHFEQDILNASRVLWVLTSPYAHPDVENILHSHLESAHVVSLNPRAKLLPFAPKNKVRVSGSVENGQAHSICVGLKSVPIKDQRQHILDIMQIYLSGTGGKLSDAFIEKLKLVDTVKAFHVHLLQAGAFFIQLTSKHASDESLFEYLQTVFRSFSTVRPSSEALEVAKKLAVLRKKHRLHQPRELSYDIGSRLFADLAWEQPGEVEAKIQTASQDQVVQAMADILDYDSFAMGICDHTGKR